MTNKIDISIITPFFKGNNYLPQLFRSIKAAKGGLNIELILINDSPEIDLEYDAKDATGLKLVKIINGRNCGIHQSRVNGYRHANGKYILFLDQDDIIAPNSLEELFILATSSNYDLILGNGYIENSKKEKSPIYYNKFSQKFALKELPYLMARNFIISPGQCLIKASVIPEEWLDNVLLKNGADDFLLWLLLFNAKVSVAPYYKIFYCHSHTGQNYSLDLRKMYKSQQELIQVLSYINYPKKKLKRLKRSIEFKNSYKKHFLASVICHPLIFLYNIYYRLVWRGYIIHQDK